MKVLFQAGARSPFAFPASGMGHRRLQGDLLIESDDEILWAVLADLPNETVVRVETVVTGPQFPLSGLWLRPRAGQAQLVMTDPNWPRPAIYPIARTDIVQVTVMRGGL